MLPSFTASSPTRFFDFSPPSERSTTAAPEPTSPPSPSALAKIYNPKWSEPPHIRLLDQALVYLEQRQAPAGWLRRLEATIPVPDGVDEDELLPFTQLMVSMPPRHGKSESCSRYFPAWYLGRNPDHRLIFTTYGHTYAAKWGRNARDVLQRLGWDAFGLQVSKAKKAASEWEIDAHEGGMFATGVNGAITGRGANGLIADDLVKSAKEAASEVLQDRNWDWWQSEALTRLEADDEGREPFILIVSTRWHERDVCGRILEEQADQLAEQGVWYVLRLPALAEEGDPLGRGPGEALWPERRSRSWLNRLRSVLSSYWWSALYQQRPTPMSGNIFLREHWQYYDEAPSGAYYPGYIFVDTAGWKDAARVDYGAWAAVVRVKKDLYWLGARHGRWSFPQFVQELRDAHDVYHLPVCIEDTPWAQPLIQTLREQLEGVVPFKVGAVPKEVRAQAASPYQHAGNFYLPRKGQWTKEFVDEHAAFPNGSHDDLVDTTSMASLRLLRAVNLGDGIPDLNFDTPRREESRPL